MRKDTSTLPRPPPPRDSRLPEHEELDQCVSSMSKVPGTGQTFKGWL